MAGKDLTQGAHQVAQKSRTTTFPLRSTKETSLPFRSFKLKAGARSSFSTFDFFSWGLSLFIELSCWSNASWAVNVPLQTKQAIAHILRTIFLFMTLNSFFNDKDF